MTRVDHLLVSVASLPQAQERWRRAGLAATTGGQHPGGTSNALIRGPRRAYLELITATDDATSAAGQRVLSSPGPVGWALGVGDIEQVRQAAHGFGLEPGPVNTGSRRNPDGELLRWRTCDLGPTALHPVIPFLIEWETQMPPGPPDGPVLTSVTVQCPEPDWLSAVLEGCGIPRVPGSQNGSCTHDDGEVTVRLVPGPGGVRAAQLSVPGTAGKETELDGLEVSVGVRGAEVS